MTDLTEVNMKHNISEVHNLEEVVLRVGYFQARANGKIILAQRFIFFVLKLSSTIIDYHQLLFILNLFKFFK